MDDISVLYLKSQSQFSVVNNVFILWIIVSACMPFLNYFFFYLVEKLCFCWNRVEEKCSQNKQIACERSWNKRGWVHWGRFLCLVGGRGCFPVFSFFLLPGFREEKNNCDDDRKRKINSRFVLFLVLVYSTSNSPCVLATKLLLAARLSDGNAIKYGLFTNMNNLDGHWEDPVQSSNIKTISPFWID